MPPGVREKPLYVLRENVLAPPEVGPRPSEARKTQTPPRAHPQKDPRVRPRPPGECDDVVGHGLGKVHGAGAGDVRRQRFGVQHFGKVFRRRGLAGKEGPLRGGRRVTEAKAKEKAVELRLRERVRPLELYGILRGEDEEWTRERVRPSFYRNPPLLHRLEESRLRPRRSAVQLVGEEDMGEDRTSTKLRLPSRREVYVPREVCGKEVGSEGHARKRKAQDPGKSAKERRLPHPGYVLHKDVTFGEKSGKEEFEHLAVPVIDSFHLGEKGGKRRFHPLRRTLRLVHARTVLSLRPWEGRFACNFTPERGDQGHHAAHGLCASALTLPRNGDRGKGEPGDPERFPRTPGSTCAYPGAKAEVGGTGVELFLMLLGFTFASSIDNYAVAITYGLRRVKIPLASNFLIAGVAFLFTAAGMSFGLFLKEVLPDLLPTVLGAAILGILGLRVVLLAWPRNRRTGKKNRGKGGPGIWPSLEGVFLAPESVDRDGKQVIGWGEAVLLGIALSANALTNGVSAGLFGLPVFLLSTLTALGSFVSVWLGVLSGKTVARVRVGPFTVGQFGTILSGALLLLIAFFALVD